MNNTLDTKGDFLKRYGPRALILGGSEGIGSSFAELLAGHGLDLTLVARNLETLERTAADLRARYGVAVDTYRLDLTGPKIEDHAATILKAHDYGLVIYNAGATHGVGLFLDAPAERALNLIRLNCIGPVAFAHHALGKMRERGRGGLILVSSMSAMAGAGYVATYAAAKSFEMILAEGLNWELAREGVDVMGLVATLTDTPAIARSGIVVDANSGFTPMDSHDVAAGALAHLGRTPVWFAAGEATAQALRDTPRAALTEAMSRNSAALWGIDI
jgi:short-subunit dehydrogenase